MGVNLTLKHKGVIVADLGRAYRTDDIDEETLLESVAELKTYAAYTPRDIEEMGDMVSDIDVIVETILNCGEKRLMNYMVHDDPDLEIVKS